MPERWVLPLLLGALAGGAAGWWVARAERADIDAALAMRPPIAVIDYRLALRRPDAAPEAIARTIVALDDQAAALEAAGFLVLRADAVAAAPERLRAPPPGDGE